MATASPTPQRAPGHISPQIRSPPAAGTRPTSSPPRYERNVTPQHRPGQPFRRPGRAEPASHAAIPRRGGACGPGPGAHQGLQVRLHPAVIGGRGRHGARRGAGPGPGLRELTPRPHPRASARPARAAPARPGSGPVRTAAGAPRSAAGGGGEAGNGGNGGLCAAVSPPEGVGACVPEKGMSISVSHLIVPGLGFRGLSRRRAGRSGRPPFRPGRGRGYGASCLHTGNIRGGESLAVLSKPGGRRTARTGSQLWGWPACPSRALGACLLEAAFRV